MLRLLLTAALIATQTLCSSAGALYLCIGCDGSWGLDAGAGRCFRHEHEDDGHAETDVCDGHGHSGAGACQHKHEQSQPRAKSRLAQADQCDCTHVLLLGERSPNVPGVRSLTEHRCGAGVNQDALSPGSLGARLLFSMGQTTRPAHRDPGDPGGWLALRASVVLRC